MELEDSNDLRSFLKSVWPHLEIQDVAARSGQRVVYFAHFAEIDQGVNQFIGDGEDEDFPHQSQWHSWGSVVVKVSRGLTAVGIARIQKEIEVLSSLDSDFFPVLLYHNVFSEDPITEEKLPHRLFVTIEEKVPSVPLLECMQNYQTEKAVLQLLLLLVDGLTILWEQEFVHRDLKPANILVMDDGRIVVIDLGIIREEGTSGATATAWPFGPCTPAYASPEQAKNDKQNTNYKSDFFSLGILAYELLSGANPFIFEGDENFADVVLNRVCEFEPESLASKGKVSIATSDLIQSLMSKAPYKRPRNIAILRHRLVNLLED